MTVLPESSNVAAPLAAPVAYDYHRADRAYPGYRWWKPLPVAALAFVFYLLLSLLVIGIVEAVAVQVLSPADYTEHVRQFSELNVVITDPLTLVVVLGSIAVMTPALWLARLVLRAGSLGRLSSVAGRLRWRWFAIALLPAVGYLAVQSVLSYGIAPAITGENLGEVTTPIGTFLLCLVVLLLLVPFQASAEEYVFRGFVLQSVGGWARWPVLAIVVSIGPFVLGHAYNWWGLGEVLVFAVVAAWLTIRTGGLEAAIGVHILNNIVAFSIPALGFTNVTESNGSPEGFIMAVVLLPLYGWAVAVMYRRSGLSRQVAATPAPAVSAPPMAAPEGAETIQRNP